MHSTGGRNNQVTSRRGARRRPQADVPHHRLQARQARHSAKVATIEYDPNRSARIALLTYADGEKRYILQRSA